jgi:hypothetical protein
MSQCVLTVCDIDGFVENGGVIRFVTMDNKVHFEININAVERARLKMSSKLLNLAKIIKDSR